MAHIAVRRKSTKLRIEHHTITINYLENKANTTYTAAEFVAPGDLRRYRQSKGRFCLSWKVLVAKLGQKCSFDEDKHVLVYAGSTAYAARVVNCDQGLNAAFREQIAWFRKSEGDGEVVFWALRKGDLEVREREIAREKFLEEAGEEVEDEDGGASRKLREVVGNWSEGVVEEADGKFVMDSYPAMNA